MGVSVYIDGRPAECREDYNEVIGQIGLLPMGRGTASNYGQLNRAAVSRLGQCG